MRYGKAFEQQLGGEPVPERMRAEERHGQFAGERSAHLKEGVTTYGFSIL